jgi:hypothetical protein
MLRAVPPNNSSNEAVWLIHPQANIAQNKKRKANKASNGIKFLRMFYLAALRIRN